MVLYRITQNRLEVIAWQPRLLDGYRFTAPSAAAGRPAAWTGWARARTVVSSSPGSPEPAFSPFFFGSGEKFSEFLYRSVK